MSNLLSLNVLFQASKSSAKSFSPKKWALFLVLWILVFSALALLGRKTSLQLNFERGAPVELQWTIEETWSHPLTVKVSDDTNWKYRFHRNSKVKKIRIQKGAAALPTLSILDRNNSERQLVWKNLGDQYLEADVSGFSAKGTRSFNQLIILAVALSIFLIPIFIAMASVSETKGYVILGLVISSWLVTVNLIGNGIPNPHNPSAWLEFNSNGQAFPIDGYFLSLFGILVTELDPSFIPYLAFNSLIVHLGVFFYFRNFNWSSKSSLIAVFALLVPFPVIFASLLGLERSITAALVFFFFFLHSWKISTDQSKMKISDLAWILGLGLFVGSLKDEYIISVLLVVLLLSILRRSWRIPLVFIALSFLIKFAQIPLKSQETKPIWKHHYLAANLLPTASIFYFESDRNRLDDDTKQLWQKVFDFKSIKSIYSKYGINNVKFPPKAVDDATWNLFMKSFIQYAFLNPAMVMRARINVTLLGGDIDIVDPYFEIPIKSPFLKELGFGNDQNRISLLLKILEFIKKNLCFSFWIFPILLVPIVRLRSMSFIFLLVFLPHFLIVFLLSPSGAGFYWLTTYLWACASPFLLAKELLEEKS